jgi:uracil-DNA glycosylase family 4
MSLYNLRRYKNECQKINDNKLVFIPKLDSKNGKGKIKIMFINERPGPKTKGTDRVSFDNNDPSAKLFKHLFEKTFGLEYRQFIFITNAIIWVPDEEKSKNYPPTKKELRDEVNLKIIKDQIKNIKPKVIISLGNSALYSLKHIYKDSIQLKNYSLRKNIGDFIKDTSIPIYPVYHTSLLAQRTRKEIQQEKDWLKMKKEIKRFI